ncbi:MAG: RNA polymerase sigma factor [Saprospiraceae bacterium]|nr:RNA polymerase sigma factor [Bacteroidia bacterium]NNE13397.1 RNA polymerase sigma factor [Saprospiraceae bacterium]NNL92995.1 RNA polymerase sigma factor [Saprospiraceae bacterium]
MSTIEFYNKIDFIKAALDAFAYNLTKDKSDAEDLFQETAFRAISNKDKFRPDTNFKAWVFTIMKNIFINNYRKKVKANTIIDRTDNMFYLNSGKNAVDNAVDGNIVMQELQKMIKDLDDSIKVPFMLHYEGFKYQEIAEQLSLPLGTVKSRIFFARKELKAAIKGHYGDYHTIRKKLTA